MTQVSVLTPDENRGRNWGGCPGKMRRPTKSFCDCIWSLRRQADSLLLRYRTAPGPYPTSAKYPRATAAARSLPSPSTSFTPAPLQTTSVYIIHSIHGTYSYSFSSLLTPRNASCEGDWLDSPQTGTSNNGTSNNGTSNDVCIAAGFSMYHSV